MGLNLTAIGQYSLAWRVFWPSGIGIDGNFDTAALGAGEPVLLGDARQRSRRIERQAVQSGVICSAKKESEMQFYNFGNEETYHCFVWLTESGTIDIGKLIAEAFDAVEGDQWYKMGCDVSTVARDKLSNILELEIQDYMAGFDWDLLEAEIGVVWKEDANCGSNSRCLFLPIFSLAMSRIDYTSVSEAILMKYGKWNPEDYRDLEVH
jgi:hypothetical protein